MERVTTALLPREAIQRLNDTLRRMYIHARNHTAAAAGNRIDWNRLMASDLSVFEAFESKLKDAFLRQLGRDGQMAYQKSKEDPNSAPLVAKFLKGVEDILTEIKKQQWVNVQRAMYLRRLAKRVGREISAEEQDVERQEIVTKDLLARQLRKAEKQKKRAEKTVQTIKAQQSRHKN